MVIELIGNVPKLRLTGSEYRAFSHWASRYTPQLKLELTIDKLSDASPCFTSLFSCCYGAFVLGCDGSANRPATGERRHYDDGHIHRL
ncbi:MAG: hypothetical protein CM1200mP20_13630 [Pseudomonadota bacterium]|nr:MAG: hypothetical protein CM1200mP20_13630 [Pseudomonadota bacterium]